MKDTETESKRRLARWKASSFFKQHQQIEKKFFEVFDKKTNTTIGHLVDLTVEGLRIISRTEMRPRTRYQFRIDLPKEVQGVSRIFADAECIWCHKDVDPEFFMAGFKIIDITPPFTEIVETLIQ